MEGQKTALEDFARHTSGKIIAEYREVETGKRKDRPELAKALAHARRSKATLVVAKLDRLARNVAFTSALMESGADFVACDNPHAKPSVNFPTY
jgi:DNA invertase Pin-like site-specific DNA recombinase